MAEELNEVFTLENKEMGSLSGHKQFITFVAKWEKKYRILKKYKADRNIAYFTYMDFPVQVQRCIYKTNWIERLNRKYKRTPIGGINIYEIYRYLINIGKYRHACLY